MPLIVLLFTSYYCVSLSFRVMMFCLLFLALFLGYHGFCETPPAEEIDRTLVETVTKEDQRAWINIECAAGASAADISRRLNHILGAEAFFALTSTFLVQRRTQVCDRRRSGRPQSATN